MFRWLLHKLMTSGNNLSIQARLGFGDLLHANRLYRASTSNEDIGRSLLGLVSLFSGGCGWVYLLTQPLSAQNATDLSFVAVIFLCLLGLAFIFDWIPTLLLWFNFRPKSQLYSEPYQAIFDEKGVTVQRQSGNANYEWQFYKAGVEGRDEFILIYGKGMYFVIPKTSFQNENDVERFRNMLKSNMANFKQRLKIQMDFKTRSN